MPPLHLTWGNDSHDTRDITGVHSRELSIGYAEISATTDVSAATDISEIALP